MMPDGPIGPTIVVIGILSTALVCAVWTTVYAAKRKSLRKNRACVSDPVDLHAVSASRLVNAGRLLAPAQPPPSLATAAAIEAGEAFLRDVFVRRLVVAEGVQRQLFEMHQPHLDGGCWVCLGCDASGADGSPSWPCRTAELLVGGGW